VYRLPAVDAQSVADVRSRSRDGVDIEVDYGLSALTVIATTAVQNRIGDASVQLDVSANAPGNGGIAGGGDPVTDVVRLHAAVSGGERSDVVRGHRCRCKSPSRLFGKSAGPHRPRCLSAFTSRWRPQC
jgi:hypothetical protein